MNRQVFRLPCLVFLVLVFLTRGNPWLFGAAPLASDVSLPSHAPSRTSSPTLAAAASPSVTVAITSKAPIETLMPSGDVSSVTDATVGAQYTLVRVEGTNVLLQDLSGTHYLIAQNCTDFTPPSSPMLSAAPDSTTGLAAVPPLQSAPVIDPGPQTIAPGDLWPDDHGKHIQAHGGGITKVGDTYYWFGEDYSNDNPPGVPVVACYSSKDLAHWQFRNEVEKAKDPAHLGDGWKLERPKVFYNEKTHKFVMYAHIDDKRYGYAHVAIFTSDTPDGDYQYLSDFRPLDKESRDIGQFIDDDGTGYLLFESRPTKGFFIVKLSDDYLSVQKQIAFIHAPLEGGSLVHYDGLYYLIGSHMTGWRPNPNVYATATNIEGPWSEFKDIAPPEKNTYNSQSTFLLKVVGTKATSVIFMGDWWVHTDHPLKLNDARYIWMPLKIGDGGLWLPQPEKWSINAYTGETQIKGMTLGN